MIWMLIARNKIGAAALVLSAVLASGCLGLWLALQVESSRADREKGRADREAGKASLEASRVKVEASRASQWQEAYSRLREALEGQQEAVRTLVERAGEASRRAQEASDRAGREARAWMGKASAIQAEKPPAGVDPCEAAREAFARELREERPDAP